MTWRNVYASKETTQNVTLIMLAVPTREEGKMKTLPVCTDEYAGRPFTPRQVTARVDVLQRRANPHYTEDGCGTGWPMTPYPPATFLKIVVQSVPVTSPVFQSAALFIMHPGRAY